MSAINQPLIEMKIKHKKKNLLPIHKAWIYESLISRPDEWRAHQLSSAFTTEFPCLGQNYLTQNHIDFQRKMIRDKEISFQREIEDDDNNKTHVTASSANKPNVTSFKCMNIDSSIANASNILANRAVCFIDLLDERTSRLALHLNDPTKSYEGLITPTVCTENEMICNETNITEKTKELVDLLVKRRAYKSTNHTDDSNNNRSIFVGYVANQRPNKRAYHFVAGRNCDIDPVATDILSALYAPQPTVGNIKTAKVVIKTHQDHLMRSKIIKENTKKTKLAREDSS